MQDFLHAASFAQPQTTSMLGALASLALAHGFMLSTDAVTESSLRFWCFRRRF